MITMDSLNDNQRAAVESGEGPVMIIAGPGTGKTKTLTTRIAWLIENGKAHADEIVALTFTNKAAREMRERVEKLLNKKSRIPKITTFHALGADILKKIDSNEKLLVEQQRSDIIRTLHKHGELKGLSVRELSLLLSRAKTSIDVPDVQVKQLLASYESVLKENGLYDFDDLLVKSYELLKTNSGKRPNYKFVLVDEFQDTSQLQYEILKLLTVGSNLFVIGDPNQSIYAFRGAGSEMFMRFRRDFPDLKEIDLTINYRSNPKIIRVANAIFPYSPQLEAHNAEGVGLAKTVQTMNEYSEAAYILGEIEQGIGGSDMLKASLSTSSRQDGHTDVGEPRDFAVLYRTHRVATAVQRAFAEAGVPYQIAGEGSPYEHPDIQKVIAAIRVVHSPSHDNKAKLVKYSNLGQTGGSLFNTLLVKYQKFKTETVCNLAIGIAGSLGLERTVLFEQFLGSLVQYGTCEKGLQLFLDNFDTLTECEFYDPNINAVTLLTIHAAKGLEFNHVFLVGAEEGILPKLTASQNIDIDEERRMFYVAVTRAKDNLEILHTKTRSAKPSEISRFVTEIPNTILPRTADPNLDQLERRAKKRQQKRAQSSLF